MKWLKWPGILKFSVVGVYILVIVKGLFFFVFVSTETNRGEFLYSLVEILVTACKFTKWVLECCICFDLYFYAF